MDKIIYMHISEKPDFFRGNVIKNEHILTRVNEKKMPSNQSQSLFSYYLLADLLSKSLSKSIDDLYFLESGKPCLKDAYVSLSHSGNLSVVGCSLYSFGVDIQEIKEINYRVASKLYKNKDVNNISIEEYYLRWTFLEAKAKMNDTSIFDLNEENTYSYNKIIEYKNKKYAISVVYKDKDIIVKE